MLLSATPSVARQSGAMEEHPGRSGPSTHHPMLLRNQESVDVLDQARLSIIMMRFDLADSLLNRLSSRADGALASAYHRTTIDLLELLLYDTDASYSSFFERSDEFLEQLSEAESSVARSWLRADAIQQRMIAWAKKGRYVRAALAGNAALLAFQSVLVEDPQFYDAYKGIGLLHMAIGALPGTYRSFLKFLGYSGTLDQGIEELRIAADSSRYSREEALIYLAMLDVFGFPSAVEAIPVLEALWTEHPGSPLFGLLYGDALIRKMRSPEAEIVLREVTRYTADSGAVDIAYIDFFLGESLFRQNRFDEARSWLESFLEKHTGPALKVRTNLLIGKSLEMEGRRQEAVDWYRRSIARREFVEERAAGRNAGILLERPMDDKDRALVRGHNAFNSGYNEEARTELELVYGDSTATEVQRGEAAYGLARVEHVSGNHEEAGGWYRRAIQRPGDPRAKWAPWSLYHLARIAEQDGRKGDARRLLRRLLGYGFEYDFQPSRERVTRLMLDRLDGTRP